MNLRLYRKLFQLPQHLHHTSEREPAFILLLIGTFALTFTLFLLLIVSYLVGNHYVVGSLVLCVAAFLLLVGIYWLWRVQRYRLAAYLLVLFYGTLAAIIVLAWGINTPFGVLLLGVTIVFASILLGPKYSLYTAASAAITLCIIQLAITVGLYTPIGSPTLAPSNFGDVFGYSVIFGVLALVSWLFGKAMEQSLQKALQAETELMKEKELLEVRVAERTLELEALQFEEMQQLYRFAEMGQLSAALLHDLANHLTVLTMDIEDLHHSDPRSQAIVRAKNSVRYLEQMVVKVRNQMQGGRQQRHFNLANRTKETLNLLKQKSRARKVTLELEIASKQPLTLSGDPTRFSQAIAILIANGIDAYGSSRKRTSTKPIVLVTLSDTKDSFAISVKDWGSGIPKNDREKLFQPFYSTKETGMGIGLFIAKQIVEKHFNGTLTLVDTTTHTEFIMSLPKKQRAKRT